ncbi:hypothetical protein [Streptacidiphilus sp. PAMC 29251]
MGVAAGVVEADRGAPGEVQGDHQILLDEGGEAPARTMVTVPTGSPRADSGTTSAEWIPAAR